MKKQWLLLAATAAASGCYSVETPVPPGVGSFQVKVQGISAVADNGALQPLEVVSSCIKRYGGTAQVPPDARGKEDCRYVIPRGPVELSLDITALDKQGQPYEHTGPVAFRVVPGALAGDYNFHWANLTQGRGDGRVRARYLHGEVRVWVADEPVQPLYSDGRISGDPRQLPPEPPSRSYAAGASAPLFFEEPTLATIQQPQTADNRSSPFVKQFVTIGRAPESGSVLYQNCPDRDLDAPKPVMLMVTGTDPSGFFVTDITACPVPDATEPDGYLPGTFGSIFVYNYSYPEGLDTGDLLWTLSGSIQEFTSTTQLTFPSWTVREHVRELPPDQRDKYLKLHPPVEVNLRHCGLANGLASNVVDSLCGYYNDNMKLESLESGLVKLRRVRFPRVFKSCDFDGNGEVPFFCSSRGAWTYCGTSAPPDNAEVQCNIECTTGAGPYQNTVCSERTQFAGFGQFVVELAGPGPREAGLDDSLPDRTQTVLLSDTTSQSTAQGYEAGTPVSIWCEVDTYLRFGDEGVTASNTDELLPAKTRKDVVLASGQGLVAFLAKALPPPAEGTPAPRCSVARNTGTRFLLTTKDAVPDLRVDCSESDPDAERALQCRLLRQATFDVVGHLRQIQPGRPRWMVMPRDAGDLCCYPGPDNQCPRPIKPCQ